MQLRQDVWSAARRVPLDRSGLRWALLREPAGVDEACVAGRSSHDAIRLLDRLLVAADGAAVQPGAAVKLTVPERDFLLAATYCVGWGKKIEGTLRCVACEKPFDFDFQLDALVDVVRGSVQDLPFDGSVYTLPGGARFRLPTGEDELLLIGLAEEEAERVLIERCLVHGDVLADASLVLAAMDRVGAGLDSELEASCSECNHRHAVRFQIQDYLLGAIVGDWGGLVEATHRLALAYHWSLSEIMALPISRRGAFLSLLDGESIARSRELT